MAQLPPKIPNMQQHNWPDHFSHQQRIMPSLPPTSVAPISITTASTTTTTTNPYWVDEFLDFSAARRASQRRSVSDSVTFLEMPMLEEYRGGSVGNNAAAAVQPGPVSRSSSNTDKNNNHHIHQNHLDMFEDDHFISLLKDEFSGAGVPPTISLSDHNSINDDEKEHPSRKQQYLKNENEEVESECISGTQSVPNAATTTSGGSSDIVDSKRVKRILANRQSAQRSRVRKLQYISELERSVTSLQAEVSVLSPRVAFLDHQRLILNVDNSALKQRIAALTQDKIFKDAHQEALKREIERLRQVYEQQNLKNMENKATQSHSSSSIVDASKLPADKDQQPLNVSS